jgi:peptidoglycan/xylan/chitin deacetylase (PgdA/CDA1 family)
LTAEITLTFDDAPGPSMGALLTVLARARVPAVFFVLGRNLEQPPWPGGGVAEARALLRRALRDGHVLGNHTYEHHRPDETQHLAEEIARTDALIRALQHEAGIPPCAIPFRLPYGAQPEDPRLATLRELSRAHTPWPGVFEDWLPEKTGAGLAAELDAYCAARERRGEARWTIDLHIGGRATSRYGQRRDATVAAVARFLSTIAGRRFAVAVPEEHVD